MFLYSQGLSFVVCCGGMQLAAVYDEYSKHCNCVFTVECVFVEHRFDTVFSKRLYFGRKMKKS